MPRKATKRKQPIKIIGLSREPTAVEFSTALQTAGIKGLKFTPIQLHAFLLKLILRDRITNKEIKLITETYIALIKEYWTKPRQKRRP